MSIVIKAENISKKYKLGLVGTGSLVSDFNRWLYKIRGKEDPNSKIGISINKTQLIGDEFWSLKDINFEVKQGEVLGIIGKNGAGKSTLLKILSKVTTPTTGSVKIKGRIASLLEVGTGFHPELTGRENIFLNGAILGMTKKEISSKIDEIIDFSGVETHIDTPVKRYSSGMYVRLAFAVAAHLEPEILIIDEVLAVGDAEFQKKCLGKMHDVSQKDGRTVLFVSHNMAAIQNLCSQALVLKNGEIYFHKGNTEKAIEVYLSESLKTSQTNINERTDRKGIGNIKVTDFVICNKQNTFCNELISGQFTKFRIFYKCNDNSVFNNISVAFSITRTDGFLISVFANDVAYKTFDNISGFGFFECEIEKLPLMSGQYIVNIMINQGETIEDWLIEAFSFNVIEGDFYGTGKIIQSTHRGVLFDQKWNVYQ